MSNYADKRIRSVMIMAAMAFFCSGSTWAADAVLTPAFSCSDPWIFKNSDSFSANIVCDSLHGAIDFDLSTTKGDRGYVLGVGKLYGSWQCEETGVYRVEWVFEPELYWSGKSLGLGIQTLSAGVSALLSSVKLVGMAGTLIKAGFTAADIHNVLSGVSLLEMNFAVETELSDLGGGGHPYGGRLFEERRNLARISLWTPFHSPTPRLLGNWIPSDPVNSGEVVLREGRTYECDFDIEAQILQSSTWAHSAKCWGRWHGQLRLREVRFTFLRSFEHALDADVDEFEEAFYPYQDVPLSVTVTDGEGNVVPDAEVDFVVEDAGGVEVHSGACTHVAGEYLSSFSAPLRPGPYGVIFTASKTEYEPDRVWAPFAVKPRVNPVLSGAHVAPSHGSPATDFYYYVHYYSEDGFAPATAQVYVDGSSYNMSLYSGTDSDGVYRCGPIELAQGGHSYAFLFVDATGGADIDGWYVGPYVGAEEIGTHTDFSTHAGNIYLRLGTGADHTEASNNMTTYECSELPTTLWIPPGNWVLWSASARSDNHTFIKWEFRDDSGEIFRESEASGYGFQVLAGTNVYATGVWEYTPQYYTISGRMTQGDGTPLADAVIELTGYLARTAMTGVDGTYEFTDIPGGRAYTVTPIKAGYEFSPPSRTFNNLISNQTWDSRGYVRDAKAPETSITSRPPEVGTSSQADFEWTGVDNVTPSPDLLYSYKLEEYDADWSPWASVTTASYDLPNGAYTFCVRAQDEALNINQASTMYDFVINAAPRVVSVERVNGNVWASRITLEIPEDAAQPSPNFVLLSEHSGAGDPELVPVRIYGTGEATPLGVNEIVADHLTPPALITEASVGHLVSLPDWAPLSGTAQYDITWGKVEHFGWQDSVSIPLNFPNVGQTYPPLHQDTGGVGGFRLDQDLRLWRVATRHRVYGAGWGEEDAWVLMNVSDKHGPVLDETIIRYAPGYPWDGSYAEEFTYEAARILRVGPNLWLPWKDQWQTWDGVESHYYRSYGMQYVDLTVTPVSAVDGEYVEQAQIVVPRDSIGDYLWIVGDQPGTSKMHRRLVLERTRYLSGNDIGRPLTSMTAMKSGIRCGMALALARLGT